ncbi:MAG: deoxyguanosinetriphosphate triphosphohydrolase [Eubacterium sp.]|nr:deoxyguanosinetriphosphate triphosphohydrolase [Eubacterium sp.]
MTIREELEQREHRILCKDASFSDASQGRDFPEPPCDIRPVYQRDRDRILHSKSFRRLKGKTQVFLGPKGDHYRNRLTHTLEVSQNARTVAKALQLNEDLTEAIALGHDLGHTPFGHAGERELNAIVPGGFRHQEQSIRVVEKLEKNGKGLNLTVEVRDGILNHSTAGSPATLEGQIVRICDKVAYVNSDIDDAIRGGVITDADIPEAFKKVLGYTLRERLNTLIHDMIKTSEENNKIALSEEVEQVFLGLRRFMFDRVYINSIAKKEEGKAQSLIRRLFEFYVHDPDLLPEEYANMIRDGREEKERAVCDFIAGMTDNYAVKTYTELAIPKMWSIY